MPNSLKMIKEMYSYWLGEMKMHAGEISEIAKECADDLLQYCKLPICFGYLERCLYQTGMRDTMGGAYWHLKDHYKNSDTALPHSLQDHWVAKHLSLLKDGKKKAALILEREHVREIAGWTELFFIGSETRKLIRKIDRELREN